MISALVSPILARPDHSGSEIDFSKAVDDPETGLQCVTNEATVDTLERERLLECVHKSVNICHYTYVTRYVKLHSDLGFVVILCASAYKLGKPIIDPPKKQSGSVSLLWNRAF